MRPGALQRTKIVCTLGPSTDTADVLQRLVQAGVDVARVNTAHGTPEEHARRIEAVRRAARAIGEPISILIDLPGPKFRLGRVGAGSLRLQRGADVVLATGPVPEPQAIPVRLPNLERQVRPGQPIHLADGTVKLVVTRVLPRRIRCRVAIGGVIRSGSGLNLPESDLTVQLPTADDAKWIDFARVQRAEWIGVSFVRTQQDVARVRRRIGGGRTAPRVMAKIEKRQALLHLDDIVEAADGVMVARGDLGVETPLAEVPIMQKRIIAKANERGKPVITATQMLESMVEHPSPTRAEVTDVANAVLDGSDALMLSAETAIGRHPIEAVDVLRSVIAATEQHYPFGALMERLSRTTWTSAEAMSFVACRLSFDIQAKAIIAPLEDAVTAFRISRFRPQAPVVVLSRSPALVRQLTVAWDVYPLLLPAGRSSLAVARQWLFKNRLAKRGEAVILVSTVSPDRGQVRDSLQVGQL
jgi:pyruvate kinase